MAVPHNRRTTTSLSVMIAIDMKFHGSPWRCVRNSWQCIHVDCQGGAMANAMEPVMSFHSTALVSHWAYGASSKHMVGTTQTMCVLAAEAFYDRGSP